MTQQPLDNLFRAVFRVDAQLDFTQILLAGRNLYTLHGLAPHLMILTTYDTDIIVQSLRGPNHYDTHTGTVETDFEVSINFTLYVASNNLFQIPGIISRFFVVDDDRVAYLPTMDCDGRIESLEAFPQDGLLITGARLNGNTITIWDFADPSRNAMGIYQVQLANLLQRTGSALEAAGQMPNTLLRLRSIFSEAPRTLREALLFSQLPDRQVSGRSRDEQPDSKNSQDPQDPQDTWAPYDPWGIWGRRARIEWSPEHNICPFCRATEDTSNNASAEFRWDEARRLVNRLMERAPRTGTRPGNFTTYASGLPGAASDLWEEVNAVMFINHLDEIEALMQVARICGFLETEREELEDLAPLAYPTSTDIHPSRARRIIPQALEAQASGQPMPQRRNSFSTKSNDTSTKRINACTEFQQRRNSFSTKSNDTSNKKNNACTEFQQRRNNSTDCDAWDNPRLEQSPPRSDISMVDAPTVPSPSGDSLAQDRHTISNSGATYGLRFRAASPRTTLSQTQSGPGTAAHSQNQTRRAGEPSTAAQNQNQTRRAGEPSTAARTQPQTATRTQPHRAARTQPQTAARTQPQRRVAEAPEVPRSGGISITEKWIRFDDPETRDNLGNFTTVRAKVLGRLSWRGKIIIEVPSAQLARCYTVRSADYGIQWKTVPKFPKSNIAGLYANGAGVPRPELLQMSSPPIYVQEPQGPLVNHLYITVPAGNEWHSKSSVEKEFGSYHDEIQLFRERYGPPEVRVRPAEERSMLQRLAVDYLQGAAQTRESSEEL
ncbi:hypothetical protein LA080_007192 [Diaporthe eres]|nr:hypothetical protein LA080_007192 [Diaporthe eres]